MKIAYRKQLRMPFLKPLLFRRRLTAGTVPVTTGVVKRHFTSALFAAIQMPSQPCCTACHYMTCGLTLSWQYLVRSLVFLPVFPEHVPNPKAGTCHLFLVLLVSDV